MAYITDLQVSLNKIEESQLEAQNFKAVSVNLNEGAGGNTIYLWYKKGNDCPITRIQFSFSPEMADGLSSQGYTKVNKNLNAGAGGSEIYLWHFEGTKESDVPITDIHVSLNDDAKKFRSGWQRLACNMNRRAGGRHIFLWVKREKQTYIADVAATSSYLNEDFYFKRGYIRMDESTNRGTATAPIFLWYLLTTKKEEALGEILISINDNEYENFQKKKFTLVDRNLNTAIQGTEVYLWYKKAGSGDEPIKTLTLIHDQLFMSNFMKVGVVVIQKNLSPGQGCECWPSTEMYLGYYH